MLQVKYARYTPHDAYLRLSNEHYILDVDRRSGVIKGLYLTDDPQGTNFVGNEQNMRLNIWWKQRHVPEKAQRIPMHCWTGDVVLKARLEDETAWTAMHTFLSDDVRTVTYDQNSITTRYKGDSVNRSGLQHLNIEQRYEFGGNVQTDDAILWTLTLHNTSGAQIEIGELGLPITLNTNYNIGDEKQGFNHRSVESTKYVFEQRVIESSFVSGHSSYILVSRASGKGDHLLIIPQADTALEAISGYGLFPDTDMVTGAGSMFYLFSEATAITPWYNGHRSLTLVPDEKRTFAFTLCRIKDYADINETLYQNGNIAVKIVPGMVLPIGTTAHLLLRCKKPITAIETANGIDVEPVATVGDRHTYTVHLTSTGEQKISVRYGDGEWTHLLFNGIAEIETLMKARAKFIVAHQRVEDPDDLCHYSFRIWNNDAERLAVEEEAPCGSIDMGGSDDRCFAPPVFLAGKNAYYPDEQEIRALDEFIENFLYGKLQDKDNYQVLNSLIGLREGSWRRWDYVWRIYNYPHVYNIYYQMYRITQLYRVKTSREPLAYLDLAYNTALASYLDSTYESVYETKNYIDYHRGNMSKTHAPMGSPILEHLLKSLKMEGMETEYQTLRKAIEGCLPFFLEEEYPMASEYCFDHASKAALYYLAQVADDESLKKRTVDTILASRDATPMWFSYCTNMRFIGCYPTPLLARPLFDRYEQTGDLHLLQKAYGATLAVWSCVDPSGKGYNGREWRFNPPEKGSSEYNYYRNGCFSGEVGMGLYGNLSMLKSFLVRDPDFGLVGYGCAVAETEDAYTLIPQDGLGVRAAFVPLDVSLETVKARIERATLTKDLRRLELVLSKPSQHAECAHISIRGLTFGAYRCSAGKVKVGEIIAWDVPYTKGQESFSVTLLC
ncbi:hypothetical protein C6503_14640 [Candidatus Poribacteria bacterium]|nr:MAG: hypothetical protein C6503_14640 [Candidatus Poribacteria bacterium]